ncbi:MAG: ABC transporter substrate-binding protein [Chloroflexota bacterium]
MGANLRSRARGSLTQTHRQIASVLVAIILLVGVATTTGGPAVRPAAAADRPVRILASPGTMDPARTNDAGSAAVIAQLFETLTTDDQTLTLRPALARSWEVLDEGRRIVFHLRPGLTFSDGSPLTARDVVRSWLRLVDPAAPSPLASLMFDVAGARDYLRGATRDESSVGLHADGDLQVTVDLTGGGADFLAVVAGPSFAIVPRTIDSDPAVLRPGTFVGSGGYTLENQGPDGATLAANPRYWAGRPAIGTIQLVGDTGGRSAVAAFQAGDLDYTPVAQFDASWVAYDRQLGPQLRRVSSLATEYYGFDTRRAPFDDARVREAIGQAVDWRRIVALGVSSGAVPATSMVPPGIPGRSNTDFLPRHDPEAARGLLADAGYPGGRGFPATILMTGGGQWDEAVVTEIERELGIRITYETMGDDYFDRLTTDPPNMWSLAWVADYPGRNDFLGVLLGTGSPTNYGHWSDASFDAALAEAGAATRPDAAAAAYDRAETVVQRQVPVVPVAYGDGWALSRTGLRGAGQNGLGIIRMAGLAWAD